jgi:hypothetical protein
MTDTTVGGNVALNSQQRLQDGQACREAALDYLRRGWSVLSLCPPDHVGVGKNHAERCKSPGKCPWHTWKEYQERLPTEAEVRGWWEQQPNSNVGIALGPVSGLVRVDAEGPDGERQLRELSGGELPDTLQFSSGRKDGTGRGWLYVIPPCVELKTTVKPLVVGEVRFQAKGAQTVLPPSRHKDGNLYAWCPGHSPDEIEPALAPPWLLQQLRIERTTGIGGIPPLVDGECIPEGQRNTVLTSLAGTMRRRGMGEAAILAALLTENKRCRPPLSEDEVQKIAQNIARYPPGNARARGTAPPTADHSTRNGTRDSENGAVPLGDLLIRLGTPRRTPAGKLVVPLNIFRAGVLIDHLTLNNSVSGRRDTEQLLASHLDPDTADIPKMISDLIAIAAQDLDQMATRAADAPTVQGIIAARLPRVFKLAYRTERGAWSEAKGTEVTRADFCGFLPSWLLDEAALAQDAPRDGSGAISRLALLKRVKAELEVLWSNLMQGLPSMAEAGLGEETLAAHRFREALVRLWHATQTWEISRTADNGKSGEVASAASLVSRVRPKLREQRAARTPSRGWAKVHPAFSAWWRIHVGEDGEERVLLAMRFELAGQIRQVLPGVTDQSSLTTLGTKFGVFEPPPPPVPAFTSGGKDRLAVLARELTTQLMDDPCDWEESLSRGRDSQ